MQALAILPMFVPSIILAYALIRVLGPNGMVDLLLNFAGLPKLRTPYLTPWGPVIGLVWDNIPLTVLILLSGLGSVGNMAIEAARDVGANRLQVLWHIILPQITIPSWSRSPLPFSASSRPSRCPICWGRLRRK